MKKPNIHRITIEQIQPKNNQIPNTLQIEFEDKEDIFAVINAVKNSSGLDENSAIRSGIALRLLGPVIVQNKTNALFSHFLPHFKDFMMKLKKTVKDNSISQV